MADNIDILDSFFDSNEQPSEKKSHTSSKTLSERREQLEKEIAEKKERFEREIAQKQARLDKIIARESSQNRKQRTHNLIKMGAIIYNVLGGSYQEGDEERLSVFLNDQERRGKYFSNAMGGSRKNTSDNDDDIEKLIKSNEELYSKLERAERQIEKLKKENNEQ